MAKYLASNKATFLALLFSFLVLFASFGEISYKFLSCSAFRRCKLLKQKYARGPADHGRDHATTPETATRSAGTSSELVAGLVRGMAMDLSAIATSTANKVESQHLPYCFLRNDPHQYH
ncbi:hypothetical protein RJ640_026578 [Escallonia rubra]|uniref:Uncharacterized protein n=1 Tax=Escallonia rubra TaxID=112253 RepID=A0AA88UQ50_9ASTE|nr:hypothetical protein RJ640_026575 [Escallonia rubra]KAK2993930.1 hypothetical protein RJ640_026578 [Escallonia rubra]